MKEARPELAGPPVYRFGDFRLDLRRRQLLRGTGALVNVTPRVLETLICLVQSPGVLISREQLIDTVWPKTAVQPNNLSQSVAKLRRALGERPGDNRFIETVPGRGYRFTSDVRTEPSSRPGNRSGALRDAEAHRLFKEALRLLQRPTADNCRASIERLEQVVARESDFALGWAWLADAHLLAFNAGFAGAEVLDPVERLAEQAVLLQPTTEIAHTVIGTVRAHRRDWSVAESHFVNAILLNEGDAQARTLHASFLLLQVGHIRRAVARLREASELMPDDPRMLMNLAMAHSVAGDDHEALRCASLAVAFGYPQYAAPLPLVFLHAATRARRFEEAVNHAEHALGSLARPDGLRSIVRAALGNTAHTERAMSEIAAYADRALRDSAGVAGLLTLLAEWLTQLGKVDLAFDVIDRAMALSATNGARSPNWQGLWHPELRAFRRHPRFAELAARLGFDEYWQTFGPADD